MTNLVCQKCGKTFETYPCRLGRRKYCSVACATTREVLNCDYCGKSITRLAWQRKSHKRHFCSKLCKDRSYKDGISEPSRTWAINFEFLESWSSNLAYWVGLMLADGCVSNRCNRGTKDVGFVSADRELSEFIRDHVTPQKPLYTYKTPAGTLLYYWRTSSLRLTKKLQCFGIVPRKSRIIRFPKIPAEYRWDLIRGFMDGDGTVSKNGRISFYSMSGRFISDVSEILNEEEVAHSIYERKPDHIRIKSIVYCLQVRKADSKKLARLMYVEPCFFLKRKKERIGLIDRQAERTGQEVLEL